MSQDPTHPAKDADLSGVGRALLATSAGSHPPGPWVPPTAEELGKLLLDYEIVKMLGRGGMGAVYMARQRSLDRPVAIKILSTTLEDADPSFAERFKNEARAMGKLNHPGIVSVYDFGETKDGLLYIVMEFVEGTDVARMIAKAGRLHTEHAMAITAHVCDALAYAHERGIIHRDIKPANIMVSYDGAVKVADFGLAKVNVGGNTLGLTQSGMAMGTLHYMAPEALMLGSAVDHRADIYAVGVMLYQMLTGKIPQGMFELPSLQVSGLDPRYDGIIAKALREDRNARYQNSTDMRTDLDGILTQPVVKADAQVMEAPAALPAQARPLRPSGQPPRPPQPAPPPPAPKSSGGWLIGTVLGVCALGGGYLWMPQATRPDMPTAKVEETRTAPAAIQAPPPVPTPKPPTPAPPMAAAPPSTTVAPQPAPAFDLRGLPEFRVRVANYQKARHAKLSDLTTRYRTALVNAQSQAPGDAAAYASALAQADVLMTEIEKNLTAAHAEPLPPFPSTDGSAPQRVQELRHIFASEVAKLEASLAGDLDQSLSAVQASLAQTGNQAAVKALETSRKSLAGVTFKVPAPPPPLAATPSTVFTSAMPPASATKDRPHTNSLGMKFVPIRITGGPTGGKTLLFSVWETRVQDYAAFAETNAVTDSSWKKASDGGTTQTRLHPVVNVAWEDAVKFCEWLSKKEQLLCRLPSDHEWSCAAGIGEHEDAGQTPVSKGSWKTGAYPWTPSSHEPPHGFANYRGTLTDDFPFTAPAGSFPATPEGLHDLWGNAAEWCADWHDPATEVQRVIRGHSWANYGPVRRMNWRLPAMPPDTIFGAEARMTGFRVVIELP